MFHHKDPATSTLVIKPSSDTRHGEDEERRSLHPKKINHHLAFCFWTLPLTLKIFPPTEGLPIATQKPNAGVIMLVHAANTARLEGQVPLGLPAVGGEGQREAPLGAWPGLGRGRSSASTRGGWVSGELSATAGRAPQRARPEATTLDAGLSSTVLMETLFKNTVNAQK